MKPPFRARRVELPGGHWLRPPRSFEKVMLADQLASILPWRQLGFTAIGFSYYLDQSDPMLYRFAIESEGVCAGFFSLRWPWLRGPFIEILAVLPQERRRGLGRAVVEWAVAEAAQVSTNLWATTSDFNEVGRAFWHSAGFDEIAPLPGLIQEGSAELLLRRRLPG